MGDKGARRSQSALLALALSPPLLRPRERNHHDLRDHQDHHDHQNIVIVFIVIIITMITICCLGMTEES